MRASAASAAIVVLGCRILASGRLTDAAARRVETAARAWHEGVAPRVIASGGRRWGPQVEARALATALIDAGVPRAVIARELWSLTTRENAIYTAALLRRMGLAPRVTLVTCAFHMRRAVTNFRAAGIEALPFPAYGGPTGALARARSSVNELLSGLLDDHLARRSDVLRESARLALGAAP